MEQDSQLLFQPELLKKDARELSRRHEISEQKKNVRPVQPLLQKDKQILTKAYRILATSAKENKDISPAAEWLIDNFYIIQEQIVQIETDFPIGFQRNIPNLKSGVNNGLPRVYDLVYNLALHTDNVIGIENLTLYTQNYQHEITLRLGELWAIPIMVRLVLVNQLARKAALVLKRREGKVEIQELVHSLQKEDTGEPGWLLRSIIDWLDTLGESRQGKFVLVELAHQLQSEGMINDEIKRWFEFRLNAFGASLDEGLRDELQLQSRLQVSIQNAVISFRTSTEIEWEDFVEDCSIVDRILKLDPMGVYPQMDHRTKDQYRRVVEKLSGRSAFSETQVAEKVLHITEENRTPSTTSTDSSITTHVGYYLIGKGYPSLRRELQYKRTFREVFREIIEGNTLLYFAHILVVVSILLYLLWVFSGVATNAIFVKAMVLIVAFFPALELAISSVNRFFSFTMPPRILPKMMIKSDLNDSERTLVVVPVILNSSEDVKSHLEKLQITALANPDPGLQFALLSDFKDAERKVMLTDGKILEEATVHIDELNKQYSSRYGDKFFVLHRKREWNDVEQKWIGWERKRGKLQQLNQILCHPEERMPFSYVFGNFHESISNSAVRFVLTLDADTRTPPGSVKELIRKASHPLNRAILAPDSGIVKEGYGIIQPRISIAPDSAYRTNFTRFFSGNVGIDPYATAVSDIYQDLFGYGVFTGKGIYDVCAFDAAMRGRLPENRILSHDLLESTYIRTALTTDIELFDDYPATYNGFCKRNHRWVRGDWQIASWLFSKVPGGDGTTTNPISLLSRWKIFDNLRRSLNPFFLIVLFITGWFWLPGSALLWTLLAFGILAFPIYVSFSTDILNRPSRAKWELYFEKVRVNLKVNTIQSISTLAILPHQAYLNLDAIGRAGWRMLVSRQKLLEWVSASQVEQKSANTLISYLRAMLGSVVLGVLLLVLAIGINPIELWVIAPLCVLWITSPVFAWYLSQPKKEEKIEFTRAEELELRMRARRTWFYFERLVSEAYSWLPPDNDQRDPDLPPVARTSPTNIGLTLSSTVSAFELGYITPGQLFQRIEQTINSLMKLDRYKGHFFNWYDIHLGAVLSPKYISTVDSGNLAAGLIVTSQAVQKIWHQKNVYHSFWQGLEDTVRTIKSIIDEFNEETKKDWEAYLNLDICVKNMLDKLKDVVPESLAGAELQKKLEQLKDCAVQLDSHNLMALRNKIGDEDVDDLLRWLDTPLQQVEAFKKELVETANKEPHTFSLEELSQRADNPLVKKMQRQVSFIRETCTQLVDEMDFTFLYVKKRGLFSIGFNADHAQLDKGTYDLLASEARIASIIAISKGDVPSEHWFRLGRRLTSLNQNEFLLSWGGTMFEYLMPLLFMRSYPFTLLEHTYKHIIEWQRSYANRFNRPWGFSESAYNILNIDLNYQYRAFGAPGLGLKRGLAEEYVVAPYATLLALMVAPSLSMQNLRSLNELGAFGLWGYYDAVDFTREHLNEQEPYKVVKIYMAHHHGMSLISLANVLENWPIHDYFHSDPRIRSCELLLQERIPRGIPIKEPHPIDVELEPGEQYSPEHIIEHATENDLDNSPPRVQLLSNGKLHAFMSYAGTGSLRYEEITLTGWKPDPVEDPLGSFVYIKDLESGIYWSAFHQPVKRKPDRYDTWFHNGKIQTSRVDEWIETTSEVCISPDHPIELHKVTLTNYSERTRKLEITSYGEIILNKWESHTAHPAFSKLFVQTDYLAQFHSLIAWRRPRSNEEHPVYLVHTLASHDQESLQHPLQFETEREHFIGRGRSLKNPRALENGEHLTGALGNVEDPIFSIRKVVDILPGEKVELSFGTGWANTEEDAKALADMFDNPFAVDRSFALSVIYNNAELEHLGISSGQFHLFQKLASYILYNDAKLRADKEILMKNQRLQANLWGYGISGDLPLIVFRVYNSDQIKYVKRMLKGHLLWKYRGVHTDLLILNDHAPSYADEVEEGIRKAIEYHQTRQKDHEYGQVFLHRTERLPEEDLHLMLSFASIVLEGEFPNMADLAARQRSEKMMSSALECTPAAVKEDSESISTGELQFFNGYGGFTENGKAYKLIIRRDVESGVLQLPPAPWINVIANPEFGFLTTEQGGGYTWCDNSRENKLTTWINDTVLDTPSEAFYIREYHNEEYWSLTPSPVPGAHTYTVTHGFGYTTYRHHSPEIASELTQFVEAKRPVKVSKINIRNSGSTRKKLSLFSYNEWVMGIQRQKSSRFVIQSFDEQLKALIAQNTFNNEFAQKIAFASLIGEEELFYTGDRTSFIGRNRSLSDPVSVCESLHLDNHINIGGEPCAAFQATFWLNPGEEKELIVILGEANAREEIEKILNDYRTEKTTPDKLQEVLSFWEASLSVIEIETPDDSLNVIMNGWLQYQTIACRMWARTGYYQAGGAFGFRDQLQDALAAMYVDPALARQQILLHASSQFPEGDVLHWWHPPTKRGIRSRITDDRLWLPYVVDHYIQFTGDQSVMDEEVAYLSARGLENGEHEVYLQPQVSSQRSSIYEHCRRAIAVSLQFGVHGLPLIGSGDWNDGMNRVGHEGKGESVWLGFFLYQILQRFSAYAKERGDAKTTVTFDEEASKLASNLNKHGWDGDWYIRAFYDDGTPLGSARNEECSIDSISQSWAIISGVAPSRRAQTALHSLEDKLISEEEGLIRLLYPPFDRTDKDPGYIKGYVPGVRENGGQYTHAALWAIKALAESGQGEKATKYMHMINPVNHGRELHQVEIYKKEPYVVAADVYGESPFIGQGGWTWYTGSAGWMYRVVLESILGLQLKGDQLIIKPNISPDWNSFTVRWKMRDHKTLYVIEVENDKLAGQKQIELEVDGKRIMTKKETAKLTVKQDGKEHHIVLRVMEKQKQVSEEEME